MRHLTDPIIWALLAAIVVNIVVFDALVLGADDPRVSDLIIAGVLGMASGLATFLAIRWLLRRRDGT